MTSSKISYVEARSNLEILLDRVADNKDIIIVKQDGKGKNVDLIAEEDLSSLLETVYLLRSPANAARLSGEIVGVSQNENCAKQRDLEGYSERD
jgi:antitoxin YefM